MAETRINKSQTDSTIYTQSTLIAGKDISITEVPQPIIDENTLVLCHYDGDYKNVISGQNYGTDPGYYQEGKFGKGRGFYTISSSTYTKFTEQINFNQNLTIDFWCSPLVFASASSSMASEAMWLCKTTNANISNLFLCLWNPGSGNNFIYIGPSFSGTGTNATPSYPNIPLTWGNWWHVAYEVDAVNSKVYLFLNGKKMYETNKTVNMTTTDLYSWKVTTDSNTRNCAFDELRVSNVVRWTEDFTPFSLPYSEGGDPIYQIEDTKDISGKQDLLSTANGYDATKTQVLKNVNGVLTWITEA